MPKYRLKASVGWIYNSTVDLGVHEAESMDDAQDMAAEMAMERVEAYAELVEDGEDA